MPFPILGSFHIGGMNSASAASALAQVLKDRNLMLDPVITVTVDSVSTGITILGEVHNPGIYRFLVGAKLRELEQAVARASSEEEMRSSIARLTRQKLTVAE